MILSGSLGAHINNCQCISAKCDSMCLCVCVYNYRALQTAVSEPCVTSITFRVSQLPAIVSVLPLPLPSLPIIRPSYPLFIQPWHNNSRHWQRKKEKEKHTKREWEKGSGIKSNYKLILLTVRLLFRIVSFHCQLANAEEERNENGPNIKLCPKKGAGGRWKEERAGHVG